MFSWYVALLWRIELLTWLTASSQHIITASLQMLQQTIRQPPEPLTSSLTLYITSYCKISSSKLWLYVEKGEMCFRYLPPPLEITGVVRMSRSEICEDSLVLAAVCCWTLTSAASARCISVFLSGLSSKFLQPMHLQMDEHMIFACEMQRKWREWRPKKNKWRWRLSTETLPRSTRSSSSGSPSVCSCSLCCVGGPTRPPCLCRSSVWRLLGFGPDTSMKTEMDPSDRKQHRTRTHTVDLRLTFIALRRSVSCSRLLKQLLQLQLLQNSPFAKQSQYLEEDTEDDALMWCRSTINTTLGPYSKRHHSLIHPLS